MSNTPEYDDETAKHIYEKYMMDGGAKDEKLVTTEDGELPDVYKIELEEGSI